MNRVPLVLLVLLASSLGVWGQETKPKAERKEAPRQMPTVADFKYADDSDRQVFDLWLAKSDQPTPLVVFIHGGGWMNGDKANYRDRDIQPFLDRGISVASVSYRFILQAMDQGVVPPVKAPLHDAARAIQTIRSKSAEWNIDKMRIAATGSSAGACTSLWLAFHDDLADPKSGDMVARESSRLTAAAVIGAQTSLDPAQLLRALKVLAFSQCSSGATTACRQSFEKAFRADPNFELLPAERGHPVWGPQFDRARRTVLGR